MIHADTRRQGNPRTRRTRVFVTSMIAVAGMLLAGGIGGSLDAAKAATSIDLGTAEDFAVLSGQSITNTGPTTITGDIGLSPGSSYSGDTAVTHDGEEHITDGVAQLAQDDLTTAYDNAAAPEPDETVATELGNEVLTGGVYDSASGTFEITGTLTLNAQGDPDTVWIFQTESTLVTASASSVSLINGADACNVFWQVGSSATLGTGTSFVGNILALQSITLNNSATIDGRALARNGAVTMDTNIITRADCTPTTEPTDEPTDTPTDSPTDTPTDSPTDSPTDTPTDDNGGGAGDDDNGNGDNVDGEKNGNGNKDDANKDSNGDNIDGEKNGNGNKDDANKDSNGDNIDGDKNGNGNKDDANKDSNGDKSGNSNKDGNSKDNGAKIGIASGVEPAAPVAPLALGVALVAAAGLLYLRRRQQQQAN